MSWRGAAAFYESLAGLLASGVAMPEAVATAGTASHGAHRHHAEAWKTACAVGRPLSEHLRHDGMMQWECALVEVGERTGRLPIMCRSIAVCYRLLIQTRQTVVMKLLYPVFLLHMALVVMMVPSTVPQVMEGSVLSLGWLLTGPAVLWLLVAMVWMMIARCSARQRAALSMRLPGIAMCVEAWMTMQIIQVLRAALSAGMLVPQALALSAGAVANPIISERLQRASSATLSGTVPLSQALRDAGLPEECQRRVAVGEHAGRMDETLEQLAREWSERLDQRVTILAGMMTTAVKTVAIIVAVMVVLMFWANYFNALVGAASVD